MFSNDVAIRHSTTIGSFSFNRVHAINLKIKLCNLPFRLQSSILFLILIKLFLDSMFISTSPCHWPCYFKLISGSFKKDFSAKIFF